MVRTILGQAENERLKGLNSKNVGRLMTKIVLDILQYSTLILPCVLYIVLLKSAIETNSNLTSE
jgi:hypothetical protein